MNLYDKTKGAYFNQADEKQVLQYKVQELDEHKTNQAKEITKLKRENAALKKSSELKVEDIENKLKECYEKVRKYEQDNVKLQEEKRVLEELRKIDKDKEEPVLMEEGIPEAEAEDEDVAEIIDLDNEDPDDDEVIAFYLNQALNKSRRTSPMTEANNERKNESTNEHACETCNFKSNRKDILEAHMKAKHSPKRNKCDNCDFVAHSQDHLQKHFDVRHKGKPDCWYWCHTFCKNSFCRFNHPAKYEAQNQANFQSRNHQEEQRRMTVPCHYQDRCLKAYCPFEHFLGRNQTWNQRC